MEAIREYLKEIEREYKTGRAREHSYRPALKKLVESYNVHAINEPARVKCGSPDFIVSQKEIPIGYIEAKDINKDLSSKEYKVQFGRYKESLSNLFITDYLYFELYIDGEIKTSIRIAEADNGKIKPLTENFESFHNLMNDFCTHIGQSITSSSKLAKMMANKAKMLANIIEKALNSDVESQENSELKGQYKDFQEILIHDISIKEFADIYAQTIAYGMFAARLHDQTLDTFSRQEAAELIPKTNPFLRKLFQYIAGYDLDTRIVWIVDALAEIFRATNIRELLKDFGKSTQRNDPIIHFYETFLSEYDPKLRKSRGVWYTPEPVVNFIVRAVDDILKTEFGIADGLADKSKTKVKVEVQGTATKKKDKAVYEEKEVHRVQILDPATGTGTFLAEIIKHIYQTKFKAMQGIWSSYVENDLIPRLNGFEILMASYAMAHLKLDMLLSETGYKAKSDKRFKVYLTNSLEEHHPDTGTLFASWLSNEANEANEIKRDTPVMVVLGNPPYSISSSNKGKWIEGLVQDYKNNLNEQNLNALSDDYVKFIRYAQYLIKKTNIGIVAFITNNSFIDGITQREMRKSLLNSFNKIYIYDLHGSAKRKEKSPDGGIDKNVFDIQQGVSINILVKTNKGKGIFHTESYGLREEKYNRLWEENIHRIEWKNIKPTKPYWFFIPNDENNIKIYNSGFSPKDLFLNNGNGIKFRKDNLLVKSMYSKTDVAIMLKDINELNEQEIYEKYDFNSTSDWNIDDKKKYFIKDDLDNIIEIDYRQFDKRFTYYPLDTINQIIVRGDSRKNLMKNYLKENYGLILGRQGQVVGNMEWNLVFITFNPSDMNIFYRGGGINYPLYLYPDENQQELDGSTERKPNLNMEIVDKIANKLKMDFVSEKGLQPLSGGEESPRPPLVKGEEDEEVPFAKGVSTKEAPFTKGVSTKKVPFTKGVSTKKVPFTKGDLGDSLIKNLEAINPVIKRIPFNPELKERAGQLRKNMTPAEKLIWNKLLSKDQLFGLRFLRQKPIDNYIVDFYCSKIMMVIEIDGDSHFSDDGMEYDKVRDEILNSFGIAILRFTNDEVLKDTQGVHAQIKEKIFERIQDLTGSETLMDDRKSTQPPLVKGEEEKEAPFAKGVSTKEALFTKGVSTKEALFTKGVSTKEAPFTKGVSTKKVPFTKGDLGDSPNTFAPIDLLDYIYAVLHSPTYREKYKEFLKIDFPRVPYPKNKTIFWKLIELGKQIREIHLLESSKVNEFITSYPEDGDNIVDKPKWKEIDSNTGQVWINEKQYFDTVPKTAYEFYIGGYQPAQKWLKDRKGRELSVDDLFHYQKIIVALNETDRLMKEIDKIEIE